MRKVPTEFVYLKLLDNALKYYDAKQNLQIDTQALSRHLFPEERKGIERYLIDRDAFQLSAAVINRLLKDEYLMPDGSHYPISLDGMIFLEQGGYEQKHKKEITSYQAQTLALWLTAIGTAVAGAYGLVELCKWVYSLFC